MFPNVGLKQLSTHFTLATFSQAPNQVGSYRPTSSSPTEISSPYLSAALKQPFTQKLEVFFPVGDVGIGYKLAPIMEPLWKHFYTIKQSPLSLVKLGLTSESHALYALSVGRRVDVDDNFAIYPNGELILSLTKDTMITTGFSTNNKYWKHRVRTSKPGVREVLPSLVCLDIKQREKRVSPHLDFALQAGTIPPCQFFLAWEPLLTIKNLSDIITDQISTDNPPLAKDEISFARLLINSERKTLRGIQVPILSIENLLLKHPVPDSTAIGDTQPIHTRSFARLLDRTMPLSKDQMENQDAPQSVMLNEDFIECIQEWIGAMHCRIRSYVEKDNIDPQVSLVTLDSRVEYASMHGLVFTHEGLLTPIWILHQIKQAKEIVDSGHAPFAVVTAWAFADQPLHPLDHFQDIFYTIIILKDDKYLLISTNLL